MNDMIRAGRLAALVLTMLPMVTMAQEKTEAPAGGSGFAAGEDAVVTAPVSGNAFAAGGHTLLATDVSGSAWLAGGLVEARGKIAKDLYAAGGDIRVEALVGGNAWAAGGTVMVTPAGLVKHDANLAGGDVKVLGRVEGNLLVGGGTVFINGVVKGDVDVESDDIQVGPQARIDGRLTYHGTREPVVDDYAVVRGGVVQGEKRWHHFGRRGLPDWDASPRLGVGGLIGALLLGIVMLAVSPRYTREAGAIAFREAPVSIGLGVALLVAVPILAVLLCFTLIGIPLAIALLLCYALLLVLGYLTGAIALGDQLLARTRPGQESGAGPRILFLLLALVIIAVVGRIPWIGALAVFILFLDGTGAFALRALRRKRT